MTWAQNSKFEKVTDMKDKVSIEIFFETFRNYMNMLGLMKLMLSDYNRIRQPLEAAAEGGLRNGAPHQRVNRQ